MAHPPHHGNPSVTRLVQFVLEENIASAGEPCPPVLIGVYRALCWHSNLILKRNQVAKYVHTVTEESLEHSARSGGGPTYTVATPSTRTAFLLLGGKSGHRAGPSWPYESQLTCFLICKRGR